MLKYEDKKTYLFYYSNDDLVYHVLKAKENDKVSLNFLLNAFENYITKLASKYTKDKYLLDDLIQEGKIALIYAINKYDYSKSNNFKYYAIMWIKQAINRYYEKIIDDISIPIRKRQIIRKIKKYLNNYEKNSTKNLSNIYYYNNNESNKNFNFEDSGVSLKLLNYEFKYISLENENSLSEENQRSNHEKFFCEKEKDPLNLIEEKIFIENFYKAIDKLDERDKVIISYRFGINNFPELTLKEIAKIFNLSSEAIRKIEKRALEKLKDNFKIFVK
ncbi:MAG: sigma-70 family RNA polymerase sigma factor [Spirochaetes bacterium]|nr:sigma-70 family RNA polymerase sigma factor [Spirochaetota bacterium]